MVYSIAYTTDHTYVRLLFTTEEWKNFIQTQQDLQVGKNMLMRARKSVHRNPLPMIFIIDIIMDFLVSVE
jgi:hypothetical protein